MSGEEDLKKVKRFFIILGTLFLVVPTLVVIFAEKKDSSQKPEQTQVVEYQESQEGQNNSLFNNDNLNFSFEHPKDWSVKTTLSTHREKTTFDSIVLTDNRGLFNFEIFSRMNKDKELSKNCLSQDNLGYGFCNLEKSNINIKDPDKFKKIEVKTDDVLLLSKEGGTAISENNYDAYIVSDENCFDGYVFQQFADDKVSYYTDFANHGDYGSYLMFHYYSKDQSSSPQDQEAFLDTVAKIIKSFKSEKSQEYQSKVSVDESKDLYKSSEAMDLSFDLPDGYEASLVGYYEGKVFYPTIYEKGHRWSEYLVESEKSKIHINLTLLGGNFCKEKIECHIYFGGGFFEYRDEYEKMNTQKIGEFEGRNIYRLDHNGVSFGEGFANFFLSSDPFLEGKKLDYYDETAYYLPKIDKSLHLKGWLEFIDGLSEEDKSQELDNLDKIVSSIKLDVKDSRKFNFDGNYKPDSIERVEVEELGLNLNIPQGWELQYMPSRSSGFVNVDTQGMAAKFDKFFDRSPSLIITNKDGFSVFVQLYDCLLDHCEEGYKMFDTEETEINKNLSITRDVFPNISPEYTKNGYTEEIKAVFNLYGGKSEKLAEKLGLVNNEFSFYINGFYDVPSQLTWEDLKKEVQEADYIISSIEIE